MRPLRLGVAIIAAVAAASLPASVSSGVSQADPAPNPEKIFATHPPRGEGFITEYVVEWKRGFLEPGPPGNWEWIWTKTHPPGSDCGKFNRIGRIGSWEHFHPPCPAAEPHEARIHVWFGNDDWECIGLYEFGSAAAFGREEPKCSQPWISSRPDLPEDVAAAKRESKAAWGKAAGLWGAFAGAAGLSGLKTAPIPVLGTTLGKISIVTGFIAGISTLVALDPPDSNFRVIARPRTAAVPAVRAGRGVAAPVAVSVNRFIGATARLDGLLRAHLTSLERAWGAANAREHVWMRRQQEAAAFYARDAAAIARALPDLRSRVARALRAARSTLVSTAVLRNAQRQIVRQGFPASITARLRRAGMTPAQIRGARREVARMRVGGGFAGLLTSPQLAASDRATARVLMQYYTAIYP